MDLILLPHSLESIRNAAIFKIGSSKVMLGNISKIYFQIHFLMESVFLNSAPAGVSETHFQELIAEFIFLGVISGKYFRGPFLEGIFCYVPGICFFESVHESILGFVLESILGFVLESTLGFVLESTLEFILESTLEFILESVS